MVGKAIDRKRDNKTKIPLAKRTEMVYNIKVPPPVAKLDIAVDSDSKGRGFESLRAGQNKKASPLRWCFFISDRRDEKFIPPCGVNPSGRAKKNDKFRQKLVDFQ